MLPSAKQSPLPHELARLALERLRQALPARWSVDHDAPSSFHDGGLIVRAPDQRHGRLSLHIKPRFDARAAERLIESLPPFRSDYGADTPLVVTEFVSPRTQELLTTGSVSYLDTTGNVRIALENPGLAIHGLGAKTNPYRMPDRRTTTLRGAPAAKVVRALVDWERAWTMRDLSEFAGTSLGSTARTVDYLDREALLRRDDHGSVVDANWKELLKRWTLEYELSRQGSVMPVFVPRGLASVEGALTELGEPYVLSGGMAARRYEAYAETKLGLIYATNAAKVADAVGGREPVAGPNLLVVSPKSDLPFLRRERSDGLWVAAASQVVADLTASPGRGPEEAAALLDWMNAHVPLWRRR